jgi:tetratricopeptide (TPR) repeat protein
MGRRPGLWLAPAVVGIALGFARAADSGSSAAAERTRAAAGDARPAEDTSPAPAARPAYDPSQVAPTVARLDSAEIYYAWGDYAAVVRVLGKQAPARPRAHLLLGWSFYRLDRMPESVAAFAAGLERAPDNLDLLNGHAFALYRTGKNQEAEVQFRRILETNPDREESIRGLAVVLYTSQRFADGLPIFDRLLREHPGDAEAEHHLVKSVDGMLSEWRRAGRTPAEMVAEAWRLAETGNRRSALEIFRWVLLVDAFHPGARLGLGMLGSEFGREPEARRALEELLHENPEDAEARAALAQLHLSAGRPREAREQVDALLAANPKDARGLELRRTLDRPAGEKKP